MYMKTTTQTMIIIIIAAIALCVVIASPTSAKTPKKSPTFIDLVTKEPILPRLDPQARVILEEAVKSGGLPSEIKAKRKAFDALFAELGGKPEAIYQVENQSIPSPNGQIPIRIYRPKAGKLPAVVYTHGGGFEKGSLNSHDAPVRMLANRSGCVFIAVNYRLTPEHKFPAQTDDAFTALNWVYDNADKLGIDATRLAVAGDSVGGNLAAVNAIRARDAGRFKVSYQVLFYPVTDVTLSSNSWKSFAEGPWLTRSYELNAVNRVYLPQGHNPKDPLVSPLFAQVKGLPPAFIANAEFDGYRDEGQAYAQKLKEANIPTISKVYPGQIHDFLLMGGKLDATKTLMEDAAAALRTALNSAPTPQR
jgi:acetyl esterase